MRPYTDHPFVGNMGDQDFSAYFDSIIAEQNIQDMLLHPDYAEMDKHPAGNTESDPTALVTSTTNSNSMAPLEDSWREDYYDQMTQMLPIACLLSVHCNQIQAVIIMKQDPKLTLCTAEQTWHPNVIANVNYHSRSILKQNHRTLVETCGILMPNTCWTLC